MKKLKTVLILTGIMVVLIVSYLIYQKYSENDWVRYGTDYEGGTHFYKKVVTGNNEEKNIVQLWDKDVFSDKTRKIHIQLRIQNGLSPERYDKISHVMKSLKINCHDKKFQELSSVMYDMDGNALLSITHDKPKWSYIGPGSFLDNLQTRVCK